jgi:hypothetical protein
MWCSGSVSLGGTVLVIAMGAQLCGFSPCEMDSFDYDYAHEHGFMVTCAAEGQPSVTVVTHLDVDEPVVFKPQDPDEP